MEVEVEVEAQAAGRVFGRREDPIARIGELLDNLADAPFFTKMDTTPTRSHQGLKKERAKTSRSCVCVCLDGQAVIIFTLLC